MSLPIDMSMNGGVKIDYCIEQYNAFTACELKVTRVSWIIIYINARESIKQENRDYNHTCAQGIPNNHFADGIPFCFP